MESDNELIKILIEIISTYKRNLKTIFRSIFTLQKAINRSLTLDVYKYIHNTDNDEIFYITIDDKDKDLINEHMDDLPITNEGNIHIFTLLKYFDDQVTEGNFIDQSTWNELENNNISSGFINRFLQKNANARKIYIKSHYAKKYLEEIEQKSQAVMRKIEDISKEETQRPSIETKHDILTYIRFNYKGNKKDLQNSKKNPHKINVTNPYYNIFLDEGEKNFIITGPKNTGISQLNKHIKNECDTPYNKSQSELITYKTEGNVDANLMTFKPFDSCNKNVNNYIQIDKLDYLMHYGDFTNTFEPEIDNKRISKKLMEEMRNKKGIVDKLINKKENVLVIGYGASGAGKTSSLIRYYNKTTNPVTDDAGVFVELLNAMASTGEIDDTIKVNLLELYGSEIDGKITQNTKFVKNLTFKFRSDTQNFFLNDATKPVIDFKEIWLDGTPRLKNTTMESAPAMEFDDIIKFENSQLIIEYEYDWENMKDADETTGTTGKPKELKTLKETLEYFVDKIRMVAPTTNNDRSSRSHILVDIELQINGDANSKPHLIIGDFAGVENEFICANANVKDQYAVLKRKDDKEGFYFYQEKFKKQNLKKNESFKYMTWDTFREQYYNNNDKVKAAINWYNKYYNILNDDTNDSKKDIEDQMKLHEKNMEELTTYIETLQKENIVDLNELQSNDPKTFDLSSRPRQVLINEFEKNITSIKDKLRVFNVGTEKYQVDSIDISERLKKILQAYKKLPDSNVSSSIKLELTRIFDLYVKKFLKTTTKLEKSESIVSKPYNFMKRTREFSNFDDLLKEIQSHKVKITEHLKTRFNEYINEKIKSSTSIKNIQIFLNNQLPNDLNDYGSPYTFNIFGPTGSSKPENIVYVGFKQFFDSIDEAGFKLNMINGTSGIYQNEYSKIVGILSQNVDSIKEDVQSLVTFLDIDVNKTMKNQIIQKLNENLIQYNAIKFMNGKKQPDFMTNMSNFINKKANDFAFMKYLYKECSERSAEGKFINSELASLRANIVKSVMGKKKGSSFTSDITNFSEECFNYYCHNTKVCFTNPSVKNNSGANSYMIEQLDKLDDKLDDKRDENAPKISDNLNYCVFTVFNITKDPEQDPPKIPYTDLTMIKMILSNLELETMNFKFASDRDDSNNKFTIKDYERKLIVMSNETPIDNKIKQFTNELSNLIELDIKRYINPQFMSPKELFNIENKFQIYTNDSEEYSIKNYLLKFVDDVDSIYKIESYALSLGDDGRNVCTIIDLLKRVLNEFFDKQPIEIQNMFLSYLKYLLNFVVKEISMINNLTYLGTLDFTQNMRNGGIVDLTCNRFYIPKINKNIFDVTNTNAMASYKEMVTKVGFNEMFTLINESTTGGKLKKMKGGQQKQIDISRLDITVNDNYRQRLNNAIFYNIFKFMRWSYYKKHDNMENIDTYIFKDYLMTIIVCVILHSMHQNKLAIGVFVDQILSMGMYYKYKNEKFLLLPYYLPFV